MIPNPDNNLEKNGKNISSKNVQEMRLININKTLLKKYTRNYIKTAKYNWFTFFPLSIFYQFNNYFNCFFLFTAVLTSISLISPLDPATAIGPFVLVLSISLIREALEDLKKARYDKEANNSITQLFAVTEGKFIEKKWSDLHVGNVIKVKKNEMIPCDIIVMKSSDDHGLCYLETTNLDGESALKPRQAIINYQNKIQNEVNLAEVSDLIEVDMPNNHIYKVEGYIHFNLEENKKVFFSIDNVLLRGGRLKNVDYIYGIVIYTGRDTKIMQNIKEGFQKQSTIEKKLNTIIIYILLVVIFLCIICTVFGAFFRRDMLPDYPVNLRKGEYIFYYDPTSDSNSSNDVLEIIRIFAGLFIIFNTLIPISLMITSEIIKAFQVQLMEFDPELKDNPDDKLKILSLKLHEDLGMVRYIFSDKTGTLTKNEMSFRACSIFAKSFGDTEEDGEKNQEERNANNDLINGNNIDLNVFNSNQNFNTINRFTSVPDNNNNTNHFNNNLNTNPKYNTNNNANATGFRKSIFSGSFNKELLRNSILEGGIINIKDIKESPIQTLGEACREFFFNISLNHNVLVELEDEATENNVNNINIDNDKKENLFSSIIKKDPLKSKKFESRKSTKNLITPVVENEVIMVKEENNKDKENLVQYQGSNPDEVVLVTAAAEIGIKFMNKDKDTLIIDYFDEVKKFKILQKFEFSSERKRSSIIVEDEVGQIKIYVKGSDEKILHPNNINDFSKKFLLKESKEHLDSFARIGLRTLCFGYKYIERKDYEKWEKEFNKKKQECIIDKSKINELEKAISQMEENLILLGVTALEDKLQDNVKNDLQEFIEAGISVWMITGDKLDTAESIGHSCKLFNDDTEVFKIKSSEKEVTKECLKDIKRKFDLMKGDCEDLNNIRKQIEVNNKSESITKSNSRKANYKKGTSTNIIKNVEENNFKDITGNKNENVSKVQNENLFEKDNKGSDNNANTNTNYIINTNQLKEFETPFNLVVVKATEENNDNKNHNKDSLNIIEKNKNFEENVKKEIDRKNIIKFDIDNNNNKSVNGQCPNGNLNNYELNALKNNGKENNFAFESPDTFKSRIKTKNKKDLINNNNSNSNPNLEANCLNLSNENIPINKEHENENIIFQYNSHDLFLSPQFLSKNLKLAENKFAKDESARFQINDYQFSEKIRQENPFIKEDRTNKQNSGKISTSMKEAFQGNFNLFSFKNIKDLKISESDMINGKHNNQNNVDDGDQFNCNNAPVYDEIQTEDNNENKPKMLDDIDAYSLIDKNPFFNSKRKKDYSDRNKGKNNYEIYVNSEKEINTKPNDNHLKRKTYANFTTNLNLNSGKFDIDEDCAAASNLNTNESQNKVADDNNNYDNNVANNKNKKTNPKNKLNFKENVNETFFFSGFRNGDLARKLQSNTNLKMVNQRLNLNDNLHTDMDLERGLELTSNNNDSQNRSKSNNKTFHSNLSSDEGDEFHETKTNENDNNLNKAKNNHLYINQSNNKNNSYKAIINNKRKNWRKANNNNNNPKSTNDRRRKSVTPTFSVDDRTNLLNVINQRLLENLNTEQQINQNPDFNNFVDKTPQANETDKENLNISDRSIIEYLVNNHFLDDSQGHVYNPTFLNIFLNKNLNDTNHKILSDPSTSKKEKNRSKSTSMNFKNGKISLLEIKNLIKDKNLSNSINLKDYIAQRNNEIDVSNNAARYTNNNNSIDLSNQNINVNNLEILRNPNKQANLSRFKGAVVDLDDAVSFKENKIEENKNCKENNIDIESFRNYENEIAKENFNNNNNSRSILNHRNLGNKQDFTLFEAKSIQQPTNRNSLNNNVELNSNKHSKSKSNKGLKENVYADPAFFISSKPLKNKKINLENQNFQKQSGSTSNLNYAPQETRRSQKTQKEKENNINNNNNKYNDNDNKESDEKRFLTKRSSGDADAEKAKNASLKRSEKALATKDPTKELFRSSLEKGKKLNLNEVMEQLENIINENEKNKKKTLLNLIDFKKSGGAEDINDNLQFKVMNLGVLIEGDSISHCLDDDLKDLFWNIVKNSKSVVCCRCSPKQKAEVVGFVKTRSNEVTLAIGDGGNDIPMIKIANIGVGIFGKEGYQAAFNSDFAISQFKFLKRLIFVHGRNSLLRNSYFIYFFFFKNVLFTLTQLWFCFFSGFSGQNFYDSWYYLGFNSFLSTFPVAAKTLVEQDIDLNMVYTNQKDKKINLIPDIYNEYRESVPFHILKFFFVFITAFIYSMITYFVPYYIFQYNFQDYLGRPFTLYDHSLSCFLATIIIHFFFLFEDTHFYNWFNTLIYFLQIGVLVVFIFIHNSLDSGELSGITNDILWNFNFWAVTLLSSSICCLLFLVVRRFDFLFSDTIINSIMQNKFESNFTHKLYKKKLEEIRKFHRSIAKFKKIFKMKNEEFDNLSDKRFKDIVDAYKRNHPMEKKSTANAAENRQENWPHKIVRSKSQCLDDLDLKEKRISLRDRITNNNDIPVNQNGKRANNKNLNENNVNRKKIHFAPDAIDQSENYLNDHNNVHNIYDDEGIDSKKQESVRRYMSLNKNNFHLFDFNSHPSKFFNQN